MNSQASLFALSHTVKRQEDQISEYCEEAGQDFKAILKFLLLY